MPEFVLKDLLIKSKDGEWGKGEKISDSQYMHVIRGTDFDSVRKGTSHNVPMRYIPNRIAERKTLFVNDVIIETAGGSKNRPTGRSLFLSKRRLKRFQYPVTCASFSRFLRIDPEKAFPEYIFWLLQHWYESGVTKKYHTQHTGVARFQYTVFSQNETMYLPPIEEQKRIASILSAYDDLIENNTRRIQILEELAQRIYTEWFVHFRFPGHEKVKMVDSELRGRLFFISFSNMPGPGGCSGNMMRIH